MIRHVFLSSSNTALSVVFSASFSFFLFGTQLPCIQSDIYIYPISDIHHHFDMEDHKSLDIKNVIKLYDGDLTLHGNINLNERLSEA